MPHVSVKCYPGRTEEQKKLLAEKIAENVVEIMGTARENVSVSIQDIAPENWQADIVEGEILPSKDFLYVKPGYLQD